MRNYKIDVLRGVAILLVLLHHFNIPYKLHDTWLGFHVGTEAFSTLIAQNGNYGVTLFFVISGFLITQHSLDRSNGQLIKLNVMAFYIRRIARILPCLFLLVFIVTLLGSFGLKPFLNQAPQGIGVSYGTTVFAALTFWMNILIIKYGWVNYALGVLWSLSVEEVFYLTFPIGCLLLRSGKAQVLFLCLIVIFAPYYRSLHYAAENGAYLYHYFSSFDGIALGCLTASLLHKQPIPWFKASPKIITVVVSLCMCLLYFYAPITEVSTWSISLFALLSAILLYYVSQAPIAQTTSKVQKIMVWIGQRSYEMYLFHLIVLGLIKVVYIPQTTLAVQKIPLFLIFLAVTFILSAAIERYYSTPLNRKIRSILLPIK